MPEEENNNSSLVVDLHPTLPPFPSKTSPLPPPPVPITVPAIAAAYVGIIASTFPDLSTKVQLNIILKRK